MRFFKNKYRSSSTDLELIKGYQSNGDQNALAILFARYSELIFGVCMKYLKDPANSEDATMEIYEILMQKLKSHDITSFKSWLYILTKNHCLQIIRKQNKTLTVSYEAPVMHSEDPDHLNDEYLMEHRENGLKECIQKLPEMQRTSIELFYFESKSYVEIAEQLEVKKDKVRSFIQNGRRNLRICMLSQDVE